MGPFKMRHTKNFRGSLGGFVCFDHAAPPKFKPLEGGLKTTSAPNFHSSGYVSIYTFLAFLLVSLSGEKGTDRFNVAWLAFASGALEPSLDFLWP